MLLDKLFNLVKGPKSKKAEKRDDPLLDGITPSNDEKYLTLGQEKMKLSNYQGALRDFNSALQINPSNAMAYMQRSKVKEVLNDKAGAKQDFKMAKVYLDKLDTGLKAYHSGFEE